MISNLELTAALAPFVEPAGIDPRQLDGSRLRWMLNERCRNLRLTTATAYLAHLTAHPEEAGHLIEALIVPETRFFRDPAVFAHLRIWAHEFGSRSNAKLSVLSAPCSSGQETYSIAATLIEAGLPPARFTIEANDISDAAITRARLGLYPTASLRDLSPEQRASLGSADQSNWRIHPSLHARVHFELRNLALPKPLGEAAHYDLIFCRNLFIYLHAEARENLAEALHAALLPGGRLILGSGDHVPELARLFSPVRPAASFAFVHAQPDTPDAGPVQKRAAKKTTRSPQRHAAGVVRAHDEITIERNATELYARALVERKAGNIRLAERRCRQALYLDPAHLPAMELLDKLWHSSSSSRLRKALLARIQRMRRAVDAAAAPGALP
jgi:chemotaxis protein methyltransferase WspC